MIYELYALKYAELNNRKRGEVFLGGDPHDAMVDMAYYIWVAVRDGNAVVIDTGFTAETAKKRGRVFLEAPERLLALVGVDATQVSDVIVTHLHYDHAGNFSLFPNARFHIQDSEMAYVTGRAMSHPQVRAPFELEDVVDMVRHVYGDRVVFHDGDGEALPGIRLYKVGGHSRGLQFAAVETSRGRVVVASDAAHYYESFEQETLFNIVDTVSDMVDGFRRLQVVGGQSEMIVPGHDPEVMTRYPAPAPELKGRVAMLHVAPSH